MAITLAQATAMVEVYRAAIAALAAGAAEYRMPDGRYVRHHDLATLEKGLQYWLGVESSFSRRGRAGVAVFQEPT